MSQLFMAVRFLRSVKRRACLWMLALASLVAIHVFAWAASSSVTYTYDAAGRLYQVNYSNGTTETYTLDAPGNRKTVAVVVPVVGPTVPTNLSGSAPLSGQVNLSWTASTDSGTTLAGYYVYRGGTQIGSTTTTSYVDTTTSGSTEYSYSVAAYDNATPPNVSGKSVPYSITTPDTIPPSTPTGLAKVSATSTQVVLSWAASTDQGGSGLAGYRIYRGGTQIGTSTSAGYTDTTVSGTVSYTYTVAAYDNAGNVSPQSVALSFTTPDTIPPSIPTITNVTAISTTQVNITWSSSTDTGGSGLAGYKVYRSGTLVTSTSATNYSDTGVVAGTTYAYTIAAYDNAGNVSAPSAPFSIPVPTGVTDTPTMTIGYSTSGSVILSGFSLGNYGSMSPGSTASGHTYVALADNTKTGANGGYQHTVFTVEGFSADPTTAWLSLVTIGGKTFSGGSYSYSAGVASWMWFNGPAIPSGTTAVVTIVHK